MMQPEDFFGVPVRIETARLVLDRHCLADFEDLAAMWAEPEVQRFVPVGVDRSGSWMRLLRYGGFWPMFGYGYWAVRHKESGRYAGDVGFGQLFREIEPSIDGLPEGGWVFSAWAHGQGIASEALQAALAWLDAQGHKKSVCIIDPNNTASLRLAARHGYIDPRTVKFRGEDTVLLARRLPGVPDHAESLQGTERSRKSAHLPRPLLGANSQAGGNLSDDDAAFGTMRR